MSDEPTRWQQYDQMMAYRKARAEAFTAKEEAEWLASMEAIIPHIPAEHLPDANHNPGHAMRFAHRHLGFSWPRPDPNPFPRIRLRRKDDR